MVRLRLFGFAVWKIVSKVREGVLRREETETRSEQIRPATCRVYGIRKENTLGQGAQYSALFIV